MRSNFIIVAGYGWTGSSAVIDLLKEYEGVRAYADDEFRLYKDPGGLIDLENRLKGSWSSINANYYLYEFQDLANRFANSWNKFSRHNYDYNRIFSISLDELCTNFLKEITSSSWSGYSFLYDRQYNAFHFFITRLLRKFGIVSKNSTVRFVRHDADVEAAIRNLSAQLYRQMSNGIDDRIVLNQALPACNPGEYHRYFDEAKTIVVNRDPRDIFTYSKRQTWLPQNRDTFIDWYEDQMKASKASQEKERSEVLRINFEELVMDYENVKQYIEKFVGLDSMKHVRKRTIFDPSKSQRNIGIWRSGNAIDNRIIGERLSDYVYNPI